MLAVLKMVFLEFVKVTEASKELLKERLRSLVDEK